MCHAWEVKQWREEARTAKLLFTIAKVNGADVSLEDYIPPHPDDPPIQDRGQHQLAAFLKSHHVRNEDDRG